jgi:hypothetical protein
MWNCALVSVFKITIQNLDCDVSGGHQKFETSHQIGM